MVNVGFGWSSIVGIALALSGAGLYFLRTMRPALARDQDIFFAAIALLCGGILFFQGWRLDPILQFAQFLSAGSAIWFAVEAVRLRGITTEQAKRSTPVVDDERPVSRVYRAELDELTPLDGRTVTRRSIRGTRDSRPDDVDDYEPRRRPSSSRESSDRSRRPRSSRPSSLPPERSDVRDDWGQDDFDDRPSRGSDSPRPSSRDTGSSSRPRRPRPPQNPSSRRRNVGSDQASSSDYVDYQPINYPDQDS